jgi:chromosome segregation ATPase
LKRQSAENTAQQQRLQQEINKMREDLDAQERVVLDRDQEMEGLRQQLSGVEDRLKTIQSEKNALGGTIESLRQELQKKEEAMHDLETRRSQNDSMRVSRCRRHIAIFIDTFVEYG